MSYRVAVAAVGAAIAVRIALDPVLGDRQPLSTFILAVTVAAWLGGFRPALLALVLGWVCADYLFLTPRFALGVTRASDLAVIATYASVGLAIAGFSDAAGRTARRATDKARAVGALNGDLLRIQRITDAALLDLPFDDLLARLAASIRVGLDAHTATILLAQGGALEVRATSSADGTPASTDSTRVDAFADRIARECRPMIANGGDGHLHGELDGAGSVAGVPIRARSGSLLGVLQVHAWRREFAGEDVRLLQLAADPLALAIERAARIETERRRREAIEKASGAKDDAMAILAHELRNPLATLLDALAAERIDEERRDHFSKIARHQLLRIRSLVDDLLDLERIAHGRLVVKKEAVSVATIVDRAIESVRSLTEQRAQRLAVSVATNEVRVAGDPMRLEQVVVNLLTNAAKYTDPGGSIDVRVERESDQIVVRVRDTGIGIRPEMLPHVFELFTQSERALPRAHGGLGIGLGVVRRLVEAHDGRIEARSKGPGKGAEFIVRLPALVSLASDEPDRSPRARNGAVRVLLVEDDDGAAEMMIVRLESYGHHVSRAADGLAALNLAETSSPDVILVDIGLPGMDGYDLARRIRAHPTLRGIVMIALTGYGRDQDRRQALVAGFDHHLVKPVDHHVLRRLIDGVAIAPVAPSTRARA